jgi:hypothetical protein
LKTHAAAVPAACSVIISGIRIIKGAFFLPQTIILQNFKKDQKTHLLIVAFFVINCLLIVKKPPY